MEKKPVYRLYWIKKQGDQIIWAVLGGVFYFSNYFYFPFTESYSRDFKLISGMSIVPDGFSKDSNS